MRFPIDFFSLLARFCIPSCLPKPTKIHQKSMPRGTSSWFSNFIRFFNDFSSIFASLEPQKSLKSNSFYNFFDFRHLQDEIYLGCHFGTNLASQNPSKSSPKWISRSFNLFIDLDIDSGKILCPTWCHLGSQVGLMLAQKSHKNRSGQLQNRTGRFPRRPRKPESAQIPARPCF